MERTKHLIGFALGTVAAALFAVTNVSATPSTHVWSPSTDIQADKTIHLTADMYIPSESDATGSKPNTVTNVGLTGGLWLIPDKFGLEAGFDVINGYGELDDHPLYFNVKGGTVEDAFFDYAPAFAVGGYNFGTSGDTDLNILYVKGARTIKVDDLDLGRVSVGWFWGNNDLLVDKDGDDDGDGVLLAWERVMPEISEKLWICLDYQGSDSGAGALAPGFSWKFADNVAGVFGYVIPNNDDLAETFTVQMDVDF